VAAIVVDGSPERRGVSNVLEVLGEIDNTKSVKRDEIDVLTTATIRRPRILQPQL
jgi:hypothetical protein